MILQRGSRDWWWFWGKSFPGGETRDPKVWLHQTEIDAIVAQFQKGDAP